jgi:hypothetical protein
MNGFFSSWYDWPMDIELINPERLDEWGKRLEFPAQAIDALQALASLVREDDELRSIFAEFHDRTTRRGEWHREWSDLPVDARLQARLEERTSLFYLLAYMAALPYTEARYRQLGVGMDIFNDTMKDFLNYLGDFYDLRGYWGYAHFAWIWRHLSCELFRLGRLQYMLAPFHSGVKAFRRKSGTDGGAHKSARAPTSGLERASIDQNLDGDLAGLDIVLLADPDLPLRADGYAIGAGQRPSEGEASPAQAWKPAYDEIAAGWRGHLVSPYGSVRSQAVFLPRAEWDLVLQEGDTVLDLHIPRKDPLTAETCGSSYRQALEFFPRIFPECPWKALYCHTWFFTPQLQSLLPPDSSIVRFQREFHLYPFPGSIGFLWSFVFGEKHPDPATAPRDTSLRRAVLDWIGQGRDIFDLPGVMFHSPEAWGSQPYMSQWDKRITS